MPSSRSTTIRSSPRHGSLPGRAKPARASTPGCFSVLAAEDLEARRERRVRDRPGEVPGHDVGRAGAQHPAAPGLGDQRGEVPRGPAPREGVGERELATPVGQALERGREPGERSSRGLRVARGQPPRVCSPLADRERAQPFDPPVDRRAQLGRPSSVNRAPVTGATPAPSASRPSSPRRLEDATAGRADRGGSRSRRCR